MKIMHITDWASGGVATYLETVCNAQSKKHTLYLLASEKNSEPRITQRKDFLSLGSYSRTIKGMILASIVTRKKVKNIEPDVLFIHSSFAGVFARLATIGLNNKPKIIYCAHGWSFLMKGSVFKQKIYQYIELRLSSLSDIIISISETEYQAAINIGINKKKLIKIVHGISKECNTLNENFIDLETFKYEKNKYNILFLGRYDYQKGFDWLIDFIHRNPTENIYWHSAGKAIVSKNLSIPKNIIDHGWVNYENIPQLILRCDAIIMPSRWEGFGLTAIEAMKYSKAVIASKNGALPELVTNNENGWLFNMEDDSELNVILNKLDKNMLINAGNAGYNIFNNRYCESKMIEQLDSLLYKTLN